MTEPQKIQSTIEDNVNAAADQVGKTAQGVVTLGRRVAGLWLGVTRTAIEAAASTLTSTSEVVSALAESMGELSDRLQGSTKKV
jgi:methyl-accepting chemotaxis protein